MGRPRGFDEDVALRQAMEVFWRKGYRKTSLTDLEHATGLHRGSLYNAFGDKRSLYRKVVDRAWEWLLAVGPFGQLVGAEKGWEAINAFLGMFVEGVTRPGSLGGCFFAFAAVEARGMDGELQGDLHLAIEGLQGLLTDAVKNAQAEHRIDSSLDPHDVALILISVVYGFQVLAAAGVGSKELKSGAGTMLVMAKG